MGSVSTRTRAGIVAAAVVAVVAATAAPAPADLWLTNAAELACAAALGLRAFLRPHHRMVWGLLCVALLAWTVGDAIYTADPDLPVPSIADVGWLAFYPPAAAALVILIAARSRGLSAAVWLDGVIAGLATAAVGVAAVVQPVADSASGGTLATGVNLAYPVGDIALLALVALGLSVCGRADRPLLVLGVGIGLSAVADSVYLALYARGAWPDGTVLDALWPAATIVIALAAWMEHPATVPASARGLRQIAIPAGGGLLALAVLVAAEVVDVSPVAALLAVGALLLGLARFALTFHEKERALAGLHLRATTDPLTNLPNHREFHERLAAEVERARRHGRDLSVVVLDLDHFKLVNDTYGHPTGDRALIHVADTLRAVVRPGDTLARIGGEEFGWVLPETSALEAWQATERARRLLLASPVPRAGTLDFSAGVCDLEHVAPPLGGAELVRLADGALYWAKRNGRGVTFRYSPAVVTALTAEEMARSAVREQSLATVRALARTVDARDPHTHEHSERVAALAVAIARDLGWSDPQAALLHEAALVHDIGKIGVPDEVLLKPGPLTPQERALIEAHAAAGARIVAGALTEAQVGWIRWHHERVDGTGYPDGLTEPAIPEGARILAVADAFDAMTAARSYRRQLPADDALDECRASAGTQFWAPAVDALARVAPDQPRPVPATG
ncbi:MAG TPA: diguanylate cyclase [Miltoncostaeaceae bacterium]|nr:diguanylate cyclase [Miltoncostaeaceae bacterium]